MRIMSQKNRGLRSVNTERGLRWRCIYCKQIIEYPNDLCGCSDTSSITKESEK